MIAAWLKKEEPGCGPDVSTLLYYGFRSLDVSAFFGICICISIRKMYMVKLRYKQKKTGKMITRQFQCRIEWSGKTLWLGTARSIWFVAFWEHQIFSVFKIHSNCNFVGLLHHPFFGFILFWHFWAYIFNFLNYCFWLRITDEGSVPVMRICLYAPITSDECHAWFHLNAASPAGGTRNKWILPKKKILSTVGFEPPRTARPPAYFKFIYR